MRSLAATAVVALLAIAAGGRTNSKLGDTCKSPDGGAGVWVSAGEDGKIRCDARQPGTCKLSDGGTGNWARLSDGGTSKTDCRPAPIGDFGPLEPPYVQPTHEANGVDDEAKIEREPK